MKVLRSSVFWGVLMVVAGGLLLLEALGALAVGDLIWSALLGAAGLGFAYVFSRRRENWWAVIPGGVLLTLALLTVAPAGEGAFFFLGLTLTFALLAVLPTDEGRMRWPIIPAGVLGVLVGCT